MKNKIQLKSLFASMLVSFLMFGLVSCSKEEMQNHKLPATLEEIDTRSLDPMIVENQVGQIREKLSQGLSLEGAVGTVGDLEQDKNLMAAYLFVKSIGIQNIQLPQDEAKEEPDANLVDPSAGQRVARYYWKYAGETKTYPYACGGWWKKKYYCKKRFGNSCSTLGSGVYATAWKCPNEVECW